MQFNHNTYKIMKIIALVFFTIFSATDCFAVGKTETPIIKASEIPASLKTLEIAKNSTAHIEAPNNKTTLDAPQYSEGGAITRKDSSNKIAQVTQTVKEKAVASSPVGGENKSKTAPTTLEEEIGSAKSNSKPRKGVGSENVSPTAIAHSVRSNETHSKTSQTHSPSSVHTLINNTVSQPIKNATAVPTAKPIKNNSSSTTPIPKKPLILSSTEIDSVPDLQKDIKIHRSKASARTSKASSVSAHPNLVIPVTITVFALPLFAVLGYYALKHGREAWKNRHYRRMDFLLDGMYND